MMCPHTSSMEKIREDRTTATITTVWTNINEESMTNQKIIITTPSVP